MEMTRHIPCGEYALLPIPGAMRPGLPFFAESTPIMLFTRVSTRGAASRLRRPRPFALGLLLSVLTTTAAFAVPEAPPAPDDPVGALQEILKAEPGPEPRRATPENGQAHQSDGARPAQPRLLLQEWPSQSVVSTDIQDKQFTNDENARKRIAQRFVQKAQDAITAVRARRNKPNPCSDPPPGLARRRRPT